MNQLWSKKPSRSLTIGVGLVALLAIALSIGLVLASGADDDPPGPGDDRTASAATTSEAGVDLADLEQCRLAVRSAVLGPDPETVRSWSAAGIQIEPIAPASLVGGAAIATRVTSSTEIPCDATSGYIGTRGGMRFRLGDRVAELRRVRLDLAAGTMTIFTASTGFDGILSSDLPIRGADRVQQGSEVTIVVPLRSTPDFAGAANVALGTEIFRSSDTFGTFTLAGEMITES